MYNALKYVMFVRTEKKRDGTVKKQHLPVIFADAIMHSDMADRMREQGFHEGYIDRSDVEILPVSAGFIGLPALNCFGRSESLELDSRPQDTEIIAQWPTNKGHIDE